MRNILLTALIFCGLNAFSQNSNEYQNLTADYSWIFMHITDAYDFQLLEYHETKANSASVSSDFGGEWIYKTSLPPEDVVQPEGIMKDEDMLYTYLKE